MDKKNILGYTAGEMVEAKKRSKYFLAVGLILCLVLASSQSPVDLGNYLWYFTVLAFTLVTVVFSQFFSWLIRLVAKAFGRQPNRFDYFATTLLVFTTLGLFSVISGW